MQQFNYMYVSSILSMVYKNNYVLRGSKAGFIVLFFVYQTWPAWLENVLRNIDLRQTKCPALSKLFSHTHTGF